MSKAIVGMKKPGGHPAAAAHREVVFVLNSRKAEEVYLCGDFNDWLPDGLPMIRHGDKRLWEKRLRAASGPIRIQIHRGRSVDA